MNTDIRKRNDGKALNDLWEWGNIGKHLAITKSGITLGSSVQGIGGIMFWKLSEFLLDIKCGYFLCRQLQLRLLRRARTKIKGNEKLITQTHLRD